MSAVKVIVRFPKGCMVRPTQVAGAPAKKPYYRGIVISGQEEFRKHYIDSRTGLPVRQPDNGVETIYYSPQEPAFMRDAQGNIIPGQYADMELECWSSTRTDDMGAEVTRKGVKVVSGQGDMSLLVDDIKSIANSGLDEDSQRMIKEKMTTEFANDLIGRMRARRTTHVQRAVVVTESENAQEVVQDLNNTAGVVSQPADNQELEPPFPGEEVSTSKRK